MLILLLTTFSVQEQFHFPVLSPPLPPLEPMTQYSIYNQTLHHLNPEAEAWSAAAYDAVEKHACVQALHVSFIQSLSAAEKDAYLSDKSLNLSASFFEDAAAELNKQLDESDADTLPGECQ